MVCLTNISVDTLHKGDTEDNNNNNNNNNNTLLWTYRSNYLSVLLSLFSQEHFVFAASVCTLWFAVKPLAKAWQSVYAL
jgi:hypothetical protein